MSITTQETINEVKGRRIIDGHLHLQGIFDTKGGSFVNGIEWYKEKFGMRGINLAAMPCAYRDVAQNFICLLYKLAAPETYVHAGITYLDYPVNTGSVGDMDPLTQYNELMELGADGIKMLEGKPSVYRYTKLPVCDPFYDSFYSQAEKDKTHILMHACDPADFWDRSKVSEDEIKKGWFYGDGTTVTKEEMQNQVCTLLQKHPSINLTLAHFFFLSDTPEVIEDLFAKYKNLSIDITPGGEMYKSFNERYDYFKSFFTKYADRILFGTDGCYPPGEDAMMWLVDRIYNYLATSKETDAWSDKPLKGIDLPSCCVDKIMSQNFVAKVGEKPREINKKALRAYYEKYKHLIRDKNAFLYIEELFKKML